MPALSVIVSFKPSERCILDCLESILGMDYPAEKLEVIVVDNSRSPSLVTEVRVRFPGVRILDHPNDRGSNGPKQAGIDAASGNILAFTDADCTVSPGWAQCLVRGLRSGAQAVTGPVTHPTTLLGQLVGLADFSEFQSRKGCWISNFPGCNFAVGREVFDEMSYKQDSGPPFGADRLMSWRMHRLGKRIEYVPEMEVFHFPDVSIAGLIERRVRYGRKAIGLRWIDQSLPGSVILRFGTLAGPAYFFVKILKDLRHLLTMVRQRVVNPWYAPLLAGGLMVFRLIDSVGVVAAGTMRK